MNKAFIALGTNIEPRYKYLKKALESLSMDRKIRIVNQSSIYETAPVGYADQGPFLNMVIELETAYSSSELLKCCQKVETDLGRKRVIRFGPRTIDLDILVFNNENRKTESLIIPHPRMKDRAFVLVPFAEIAPGHYIPIWNSRVDELLDALPDRDKDDVVLWAKNGLAQE